MRKEQKGDVCDCVNISAILVFSVIYTVVVFAYFYLILNDWSICIIIAGVFFPYALVLYRRYVADKKIKKLESQFSDALRFISSSLAAGMSIENCFYEFVEKSCTYGKSDLSVITEEFHKITGRMDLHMGLSDSFEIFAKQSGSSDIKVFSVALSGVCRNGGDIIGLVRNTAASLRIKRETEEEISLILSDPKYNHRIITVMPILIVFLMKFISPDYMSQLHYGVGKLIDLIAAIFIVVSFLIGNKIADIEM